MGSSTKSDWAKVIAFLLAILPLVVKFFFKDEAEND